MVRSAARDAGAPHRPSLPRGPLWTPGRGSGAIPAQSHLLAEAEGNAASGSHPDLPAPHLWGCNLGTSIWDGISQRLIYE